jgi:hypothetical protein
MTAHTRRQVLQMAGGAVPLLALGSSFDTVSHCACSSDGRHQFSARRDGIHWTDTVTGKSRLFLPLGTSFAMQPGAIAPDLRHLVYTALDRRTGSNIWTVPIVWRNGAPDAGTPAPFFHSGAIDMDPRFSRDGKRIAWTALAGGTRHSREREFPSG